jgi:hypothetical protein
MNKVIAQLVGKDGKGTFTVVFKKAHGHISMVLECGHGYIACNVFACIIGYNENAVIRANAHTKYSILCTNLKALFKCELFNISPVKARKHTPCYA